MNFLSHKISTHSGLILVVIANDTALSNLGLPPKVPLTHLKQGAITQSLNSGLHSPQNTESRGHPSMRSEVWHCMSLVNVYAHFLSCVWFFVTPWPVALQALLPVGFSSQEYCSGCHFLLQGTFLAQGWTCVSHASCSGRRVPYHQCHLGSTGIWFESSSKKKKESVLWYSSHQLDPWLGVKIPQASEQLSFCTAGTEPHEQEWTSRMNM